MSKINISKYIENEKDISRCKISILESISELSLSKKRILGMEKSFVGFPFEDMNFSNRHDAESAMLLYRSYRSLFNKKYSISGHNNDSLNKDREFSTSILRDVIFNSYKKILFLYEVSMKLKTSKLEEVNLVQNEFFFNKLQSYIELKYNLDSSIYPDISNYKIDDLVSIEPAIIAKKRARVQAILMSVGIFISRQLEDMGANKFFSLILSAEGDLGRIDFLPNYKLYFNMVKINEKLNCIIEDIDRNIFKNYNISVDSLKGCLAGTMGYNKYLFKTYKLDNIFDNLNSNIFPIVLNNLTIDSIVVANISSCVQSLNKPYGVLLPIKRVGNEKLFPFYYRIFASGVDISNLFYNKFFNVQCNNLNGEKAYYKAMVLRPEQELDILSKASDELRLIISRIRDICIVDNVDGDHKNNISNSKEKNGNFISIDMNNSCIYISKTRTDGEMIFDAMKIVDKEVEHLKADYFAAPSSYDGIIADRIKSRKNKIFSL